MAPSPLEIWTAAHDNRWSRAHLTRVSDLHSTAYSLRDARRSLERSGLISEAQAVRKVLETVCTELAEAMQHDAQDAEHG